MSMSASEGFAIATTHAPAARRRHVASSSEARHARPLVPGERIEGTPYVVVGLIGQGGMGEVYEAVHGALARSCVLKVLHRDHRDREDLAARMREEARSLAQLRHPNLVHVFDLGLTSDGRPFFAMELLEGRDLRRELALTGPLPVRRALEIVAQALDGLSAAHAAGLVHRDVKLDNLFLCADGTVKVLDFGVAKVVHSDLVQSRRGVAIGTPRNMAPEQCAFGPVDARTDLYAAGLALYELVAGRGPFDDARGNPHALRYAHHARTPPPPSRFAPQPVPEVVEGIILRALAKSPDDRFQSAAEMADALRSLAGERRRRSGPPPAPAWDAAAEGERTDRVLVTPDTTTLARATAPASGAQGPTLASVRPGGRSARLALERVTDRAAPLVAVALAAVALGVTLARTGPPAPPTHVCSP